MQFNADIGEGLDSDNQLFPHLLDHANIVCGKHAGNTKTIRKAVRTCAKYNISP